MGGGSRMGLRGATGSTAISTPVYPTTSCMYKGEVLAARLTAPGSGELTLRKGDTVFVLQDASPGNYTVVDPDGRLGEVPCSYINLLQNVPPGRLQPAANGLGPAASPTSLPAFATSLPPSALAGTMPGTRPESQLSSNPSSRPISRVGSRGTSRKQVQIADPNVEH